MILFLEELCAGICPEFSRTFPIPVLDCATCERTHIICRAEGYPLPTVAWTTADGTRLASNTGSVNYTIPEVSGTLSFNCTAKQPGATETHRLLVQPVELEAPRIVNTKPTTRDGKVVHLQWEPVKHADHYVIHINVSGLSGILIIITIIIILLIII